MIFTLICGNFKIIFSARDVSEFFNASIMACSTNDLLKTLSLDSNANLAAIVKHSTSFLRANKEAASE